MAIVLLTALFNAESVIRLPDITFTIITHTITPVKHRALTAILFFMRLSGISAACPTCVALTAVLLFMLLSGIPAACPAGVALAAVLLFIPASFFATSDVPCVCNTAVTITTKAVSNNTI